MMTDTQVGEKPSNQGGNRDLVKFSDTMGDDFKRNKNLEVDDGKKYDQFKGKKTTYKDETYTTSIKEDQITDEMKK
jgi:hypothetical protein